MTLSAEETKQKAEEKKKNREILLRNSIEEREKRFRNEIAQQKQGTLNENFQPKGKMKQSWADEVKRKREEIRKKQEEEKEAPNVNRPENDEKGDAKKGVPQIEPEEPAEEKSHFMEEPGSTSPKLFQASELPSRKEQRSAQLEMELRLVQKEIKDIKDALETQKSSETPEMKFLTGMPSGNASGDLLYYDGTTYDWKLLPAPSTPSVLGWDSTHSIFWVSMGNMYNVPMRNGASEMVGDFVRAHS